MPLLLYFASVQAVGERARGLGVEKGGWAINLVKGGTWCGQGSGSGGSRGLVVLDVLLGGTAAGYSTVFAVARVLDKVGLAA